MHINTLLLFVASYKKIHISYERNGDQKKYAIDTLKLSAMPIEFHLNESSVEISINTFFFVLFDHGFDREDDCITVAHATNG